VAASAATLSFFATRWAFVKLDALGAEELIPEMGIVGYFPYWLGFVKLEVYGLRFDRLSAAAIALFGHSPLRIRSSGLPRSGVRLWLFWIAALRLRLRVSPQNLLALSAYAEGCVRAVCCGV
jgi:hypothetical protein